MAVYELLRDTDTPPAVVINEALELARTFSTEEAVKFINGMLDAIRKKLESTPQDLAATSALMSSQDEQIQQRRANLEELASSASRSIRAVRARAHDHGARRRVRRADARRARGRARRDGRPAAASSRSARSARRTSWCMSDGRAKIQVYVRQDSLPRARFPDLQAARLRRLGRRRRAAVPHEDQRADDLGVAAALPGEVPAAAAGEVARADGRRDPLPPALPRSDRQPRFAARVRDAQPRRRGDPRRS